MQKILIIISLFVIAACGKTTGLAPGSTSGSTSSSDKIIESIDVASGNLGGSAGADATCQASFGSTYKAMVVDGARKACTTSNCSGGVSEHTDWVLSPSTSYKRPDGTIIGTTNSVGIFTSLTDSFTDSKNPWTGLATNWTQGVNCTNWTSTGSSGMGGSGGSIIYFAWSAYTQPCSTNSFSILCVEQ